MTLTKKTNLTIIIFSVLVIFITVFAILPIFRQINNNSKALVSQKENTAVLEADIAELEKFEVLRKELKDILERIDNLFVNSAAPVEFVDFLESASEKHRLKIDILSASDKKVEKDAWPYLDFQITAIGSFPDFSRFLEKLENSPYLIEVNNISVNKLIKGESFSPDKIKAAISIKVFVK